MTTLTTVASGRVTSGPTKVHAMVLPQRFDVHEVPQFASDLDRIVTAGSVVVIDASEVRYMDRSGMDALIEARLRCMDHGGDLALAAPSVAARVILELSGRYEALNPIDAAVRQELTLESEEAA
jgi:anti-anti-sigma factor